MGRTDLMSMVILLAVFIPLAGLAGFGAGWMLRSNKSGGSAPAAATSSGTSATSDLAREQLARLQELTSLVAAEVDEHVAVVREINEGLSAAGQPDAVVGAVTKLIEANQRMQSQLDQAENRLQAQARQIETSTQEARTDALTQVANRRCFDDEIRRCLGEFQRKGKPTALMMIDVDHFKRFNDTQGHQAGDEVLRGVAKVLRQTVAETEIVARYGGEEFAILFTGSSLTTARQVGEKARRAIAAATFNFQGKQLRVTASAGLAEFSATDDEKGLVKRADEALYAAKHHGRNCGFWNDGQQNHLVEAPSERSLAGLDAAAGKAAADAARPGSASLELELGVSPRNIFVDDLVRRLAHCKRGTAPMSLLLLQVDGAGRIIADRGPQAAQRVMRIAAQLLKAAMRDMDHLSLISDDTFALLLPGAKLPDTANIGERVRRSVERCRLPNQSGTLPTFTVSIGCVEAIDGDDMRMLMERARRALEAAVQKGRNATWFHDGAATRPAGDLPALLAR